jgi:6-pyruvoyl tetrahydropterin synthase/QueD family protein
MRTRTIITRVMEFDAGHMLKSHLGFCKHAHGHRYRLEVSVQGEIQEEGCETGMVKDFSFIKKMLMDRVHAILDHSFMIEHNDPRNTSYNPDEQGRASGTSGADIERIEAFHKIGRQDPVEYVKPWSEVLDHALGVLNK